MIGIDSHILLQLLRGQPRHGSHAERLQAFYRPQARGYDAFRERLLSGRGELIERLDLPAGARLVELGGGTGRNLLYFGERLQGFESVTLVDLCPALLEVARERIAALANVQVVEADATLWRPKRPVDCVYFSYALTMIPDWRRALDNALGFLKPGGLLGVVDFYVSAPRPDPALVRHNAFTRHLWPRWFAHDGVHLGPERLSLLRERLPDHVLMERRGPVPYLPGLQVPFFVFVGRRQSEAGPTSRP